MTTCYRPLSSTILNVSGSDIPCDGASPTGCCEYGDVCMSNGICQSTKPITATTGTGFYLQACTDSTFQSPIGQETFHCTTLAYPDIVYNATLGLWACCSSDPVTRVNCSTTTNERWAAPAPDSLASIASLGQAPATSATPSSTLSTISPSSSTITTSILVISTPSVTSLSLSSTLVFLSTSQTSPSPVPSTAPTSTTTSSSLTSTSDTLGAATTTTSTTPRPTISAHKPNLSTPTAAGIAAGVVLGLIALLTLAFFAAKLLRARKARSRERSNGDLFGGPDPTTTTSSLQPTYTRGHKTEVVVPGVSASHGDIAYAYYNPAHRFTGEPRFPP